MEHEEQNRTKEHINQQTHEKSQRNQISHKKQIEYSYSRFLKDLDQENQQIGQVNPLIKQKKIVEKYDLGQKEKPKNQLIKINQSDKNIQQASVSGFTLFSDQEEENQQSQKKVQKQIQEKAIQKKDQETKKGKQYEQQSILFFDDQRKYLKTNPMNQENHNEETEIDFITQNLVGQDSKKTNSQNNSKSSGDKNSGSKDQQNDFDNQIQEQHTYEYVLELVGNTYLQNLGNVTQQSKPEILLPPQIQTSSTVKKQIQTQNKVKFQSKTKDIKEDLKIEKKQKEQKNIVKAKEEKVVSKNVDKQQKDTKKIEQPNFLKKKNHQIKTQKQPEKVVKAKDLYNKDTQNVKVISKQPIKEPSKPNKSGSILDNPSEKSFPRDKKSQDVYLNHHPHQKNYQPYQTSQRHRNAPQNQAQYYEDSNGWRIPIRGNVVYDRFNQPWLNQVSGDKNEQYFQKLKTKKYLSQVQKEQLQKYMNKKKYQPMVYPPPYTPFNPAFNPYINPYYNHPPPNFNPNYYYPSPYSPFPYQPSQEHYKSDYRSDYRNGQVSSKSQKQETRVKQKKQKKQKKAKKQPKQEIPFKRQIEQVIRASKKEDKKLLTQSIIDPEQYYRRQEQKILSQRYSYKKHEKKKQQQKIERRKEESEKIMKKQLKTFLLYNIPVILTREKQIYQIEGDVFLLPYSAIMVAQNNPSKLVLAIQQYTKLGILQKLKKTNDKEIKECGRDIIDGTLMKIRINSNVKKVKFSVLYLLKLSTMLDETSKEPYGQKILKQGIMNVIGQLVKGLSISKGGKVQDSLIIHGGYFPGVKRQKTPQILSTILYLTLSRYNKEHSVLPNKIKRIVINVPKKQQYEQYAKYLKKCRQDYLQNYNPQLYQGWYQEY